MVREGWWANYCYTTRDSLAGFHKVGYRIATKKNGRSLRLLLYLTWGPRAPFWGPSSLPGRHPRYVLVVCPLLPKMRNSGLNLNFAGISMCDAGISLKFKLNLVNDAFSTVTCHNHGSIFTVWIFSQQSQIWEVVSQLGLFHRCDFPPPISPHNWDFLHRSRRSQIGEVFHSWDFSQMGFPPPISALSDRGSIFTVEIFLGFCLDWDFLH